MASLLVSKRESHGARAPCGAPGERARKEFGSQGKTASNDLKICLEAMKRRQAQRPETRGRIERNWRQTDLGPQGHRCQKNRRVQAHLLKRNKEQARRTLRRKEKRSSSSHLPHACWLNTNTILLFLASRLQVRFWRPPRLWPAAAPRVGLEGGAVSEGKLGWQRLAQKGPGAIWGIAETAAKN